jgi:hypothetical protein
MTGDVVEYAACAALGALVGAVELLGRYRDSPGRIAGMAAFRTYVAVNAFVSIAALALARANHWTFGITASVNATRVAVSGVAGLAVLRSGFALVRIGDRDVPAGPGAIVTGLLAVIERMIDRKQATERSANVAKCMQGVSFDLAAKVLPRHCLLLLRNATPEETTALAAAVAEIAEESGSDQARAYNLGVALINFAGPEVVKQAVETLHNEISTTDNLDFGPDTEFFAREE